MIGIVLWLSSESNQYTS